jgi:hypothetical protein
MRTWRPCLLLTQSGHDACADGACIAIAQLNTKMALATIRSMNRMAFAGKSYCELPGDRLILVSGWTGLT